MTCTEIHPSKKFAKPLAPRPEVTGWYPTVGTNRGRVKSIFLIDDRLTINIVFCDGAAFVEHTTIVVERATPFFAAIFQDAENYTGPISERQGRLWEFDYMKILVEMTSQGPSSWFLRAQLASLKIVPWPIWFDNRPKRQRTAA